MVTCLLCAKRVWFRFLLCPDHRQEYGEYKTWPPWLLYMAREERSRRYRASRGTMEYSDSSLDGLVEAARARGTEDSLWVFLARVTDNVEVLTMLRLQSIEVLRQLPPEDLCIALLREVCEFTYDDIGDIMGIGRDGVWKRWARIKKRLHEVEAATAEAP